MRSISLELDRAFEYANQPIVIASQPTPAQEGALSCHERLGLRTNRSDWTDSEGSDAAELADLWDANESSFWELFAESIQGWASSADAHAGAMLGYWLTWTRKQGISDERVGQLTRFLAEPRFPLTHGKTRSVRRYPTGGISEKQAILLPAVLRLLSVRGDFHSSFLIARRLGHTGGTSDKLGVLPGFSVPPASDLRGWDGSPPSVRYFTADASFCPRDEVLYFLRGETGTVRQLGLIVASIISKQYALQADATLLDVLYGDGAFFRSIADAQAFCVLAEKICGPLGFHVDFALRSTSTVAWRSIGNAAEIAEVLDLLRTPADGGIPKRSELSQAAAFSARLTAGPSFPEDDITASIRDAWQNGDLLSSLYGLWFEHGVTHEFIDDLKVRASEAILGQLNSVEVSSEQSGYLRSANIIELADIVNNSLNAYSPSSGGLPASAGMGGLTLGTALGGWIERGDTIFRVHSSNRIDSQVVADIQSNLSVGEAKP